MNKKRIRLTESDLHRIVKEAVKRVLRESEDNRTFPEGFTEYDNNDIDFGDHYVEYSVRDGNGELGDEEGEYWGWDVSVYPENGKPLRLSKFQYAEDSAKWTFYEIYERICKKLGIQPARMI